MDESMLPAGYQVIMKIVAAASDPVPARDIPASGRRRSCRNGRAGRGVDPEAIARHGTVSRTGHVDRGTSMTNKRSPSRCLTRCHQEPFPPQDEQPTRGHGQEVIPKSLIHELI